MGADRHGDAPSARRGRRSMRAGGAVTMTRQAKTAAERARNYRIRQRMAIAERDGLVCRICGCPILEGEDVEVDHRTPRAAGGPDHDENKQLAHKWCNRAKSDAPQTSMHRVVDVAVMA